jgi:uncharacterized YigZ family protein
VKGSKHFAYAFPIFSKEEFSTKLDEIKVKHHSARHYCYAYRLGLDMEDYRANDDGEPSGTAGKPILGQIRSFELTNVLIIVVRYFGGTKLGVGGLIDAYKSAAKLAIEDSVIVKRQVHNQYKLHFPYAIMSEVMNLLKQQQLEMIEPDFQASCTLQTKVRLIEAPAFEASLEGLEGVTFSLLYTA